MLKLYKFFWDCGRQGNIEGVFIAEESDVEKLSYVYFGEVLGKHSEIGGDLEEKDITIVSEDQELISKLEEVFGSKTISGYNPLEYSD